MQAPPTHPRAGTFQLFPGVAGVQITTPEGVASTLHRPKPVNTATVFLPKDAVVVFFFFETDAVNTAHGDFTAETLQESLELQSRTV